MSGDVPSNLRRWTAVVLDRLQRFGVDSKSGDGVAARSAIREPDGPSEAYDGAEFVVGAPARVKAVANQCEAAHQAFSEITRWVLSDEDSTLLSRLDAAVGRVVAELMVISNPPTHAVELVASLTSGLQKLEGVAKEMLNRNSMFGPSEYLFHLELEDLVKRFETLGSRLAKIGRNAPALRSHPAIVPSPAATVVPISPDGALITRSEPLRSRLDRAKAHLQKIERDAQRLDRNPTSAAIESLVDETKSLLEHLERNDEHALIARHYLVVALPGLQRTLAVAARATEAGFVEPDLVGLDATVSTMRSGLDEVREHLLSAAQDAFDLEHDVWSAQLDEPEGSREGG